MNTGLTAAEEPAVTEEVDQFMSGLKAARIVAGQMARWPSDRNASDEILVKQMNGIIKEMISARAKVIIYQFPDLILVLQAGVALFRATQERAISSQTAAMTAWLNLLDDTAVLVIPTHLFPQDIVTGRAVAYWSEWMDIASDAPPLMVGAEEEE